MWECAIPICKNLTIKNVPCDNVNVVEFESLVIAAGQYSTLCILIDPDVICDIGRLRRLLHYSGIRAVIVSLLDRNATYTNLNPIADVIGGISAMIESIDITCFRELALSTDLCQIICESTWKYLGGVDLGIATNVCAVVARCIDHSGIKSVSFNVDATRRTLQCMNIGLCLSICENITAVTIENTTRSNAFCGGTIDDLIDVSTALTISQSNIKSIMIKNFTLSEECIGILNCMMKCASLRSIKFELMLWSFSTIMSFINVLVTNNHVINVSIGTNCDEEILLSYLCACSHLRTLEFGTEYDTGGIKQKYTEQKINSILDINTNLVSCVSLMSPATEVAVRRCEKRNEHLKPAVMTRILIDLCMTIGVVLQSPYLINDIYNTAYTNSDSDIEHVKICIGALDSIRKLELIS